MPDTGVSRKHDPKGSGAQPRIRPDVRRLTQEDAQAWWTLRLQGLRDHPGAFGSDYVTERNRTPEEVEALFATRNASEESLVLGAFDPATGALLGMCGCLRETGAKETHKAMVWGMYVATDARGRGVGRLLLNAAVARARSWSGIEQVHLTVAADNEPARALYRAAGFTVWGHEPHALKLPDRYVDEEHMVLVPPSEAPATE